MKDKTHTKPHEFALNPTLTDHPHQNQAFLQKKPNEIKDLAAISAAILEKNIVINQRHADGCGSAS
ncbi:MAG: hypothetical protein Q7U28_13780 [Aquabacterium sp.]|nr:hypothetical protein [Aquabacterium sp.]